MSKLGEYTDIRTGKLDANASSKDGAYPFFTCSKEPLKIDTYTYDCECVLVAGNGDLNVKYYNGKFDAYQRTYIVESKDKNKLYVPYLYLFLDGYLETLRQQSIGGVIKYIKLGNLTEAEIPLPPLEEQKKIADELDKINALIEKRKEQIEKLDLLVKAKFIEMFGDPEKNPMGWEVKTLDNFFEISSSKRLYKRELTLEGIPFYKISDLIKKINNDIIVNSQYISKELFEELKQKNLVPKKEDILITTRGTLGKCYIVKDTDAFYFQDGMISWLGNKKQELSNIYLVKLFDSEFIKNQIKTNSGGATVEYISINKLKELKILYPDVLLQNQFVDFVQKTESTKEKMQKGLEQLEILYKERMQEYFE